MQKFPRIKIRRGDISLVNQKEMDAGQLFWSYINSAKGHTFSEGQLWIKDPSDPDHLTEIANRRAINSLVYKGPLAFIDEKTFENAHVGDFYSFAYNDNTSLDDPFIKGDLLLITKTDKGSIEYLKIPGGQINKDKTDLDATLESDAILELESRLRYCGEIKNTEEFFNINKRKGNFYIISSPIYVKENLIKECNRTPNKDGLILLLTGDFIWWTGDVWEIIPFQSGVYFPNEEEIDNVVSFDDFHKTQLKKPSTFKEAIDTLNVTKASLDSKGKIPYSQLPDEARNTFTLRGKFYPIKNFDFPEKEIGQREWPTDPLLKTGFTWIVDCEGVKNLPYIDKANPKRVIELNTGDFVVWVENTNQFEVLDNSDHVTQIKVKDERGEWVDVSGPVSFQSDNDAIQIFMGPDGGIHIDSRTLALGKDVDGVKDYLPIFISPTELGISKLHQDNEEKLTISDYDFQVGAIKDKKDLTTFGNAGVVFSVGGSLTTYVNNYSFIDSAHLLKGKDRTFFRSSRIHASEANDFALADEILDIFLPQISGTLVARDKNDKLSPGYLTKNSFDGIVTDSLTAEEDPKWGSNVDDSKTFIENSEDGFVNVGLGRTTSEDLDTGEITFYAKSKDYVDYTNVDESNYGFYTNFHGVVNNSSLNAHKKEHLLNRNSTRSHLVINPDVLGDHLETFVKMPFTSGVLITWEEICDIFGDDGVPLMIPAWELKAFPHKVVVGLDTSPITIRLNRDAHGKTLVKRENNLAQVYGKGKTTTWSYIGSSQVGSLVDKERGSKDDVVTFDAWVESQRAIVTKEAFILPASSFADDKSSMHPLTGELKEDSLVEKKNYLKEGVAGEYSRILPSRTLYPHESVFYDPITGKLKPQELSRDVEMPAEGGVLLTSRSRIDGGVFIRRGQVIDTNY